MRILLINDDYAQDHASSPANIVKLLAQGYVQKGHDVQVLTSHRTEQNPHIVHRDSIHSLPISYPSPLRHINCLWMPRVSTMIDAKLKQLQPDIVHVHNIHTYLTYDALRIAAKHTPNIFITIHDVFPFAFHRLNIQRFLDSHGRDTHLSIRDHLRAVGLQYNPIRNVWIRSIFRRYPKRIIAVSHALEHALNQHGITNTCTIHNGIDVSTWTEQQSAVDRFKTTHHLHQKKVILFGGRLSPDKGTTPLLQTIMRLRKTIPHVLLLVLGAPKRWNECIRIANIREDIHNFVHCAGWLHGEELKAAYFAADIVTVPSLCLDCFPQTNLEAMAASRPIVGTMFGGTAEVVTDRVTGFIIDPRNIDQFAEKLHLLLTNHPVRKRMSDAGRRRVEEHFSLSAQVDAYLELFNR